MPTRPITILMFFTVLSLSRQSLTVRTILTTVSVFPDWIYARGHGAVHNHTTEESIALTLTGLTGVAVSGLARVVGLAVNHARVAVHRNRRRVARQEHN